MRKNSLLIVLALAGLFGMWGSFGSYGGAEGAPASSLQFTFGTTTAPHAALGVPVQWSLTVLHTGPAKAPYTKVVNLIAPDSKSYVVYNKTVTYAPGLIDVTTQDLVTSTLTSQTGTFQLVGQILEGAAVKATQSIPLTITEVPANGVYISVGGAGPDSADFGLPTNYATLIANLSASPLTVTTQAYLTMPDGTQPMISASKTATYAPHTNSGTGRNAQTNINASVWPNATPGNYAVVVNVLDASNNILASDSYPFTRNALPATRNVPTFTDITSAAGIPLDRILMNPPRSCVVDNSDYMMGGAGMAVGDVDGDGFDDLYFNDMMGMGKLYRNNRNGTFSDITAAANIPTVINQSASIFGDINNDGYPDLLILTNPMLGIAPPVMLKNNGRNAGGTVTFTNITATAGITVGPTQNLIGATFGDYDSDGLLDLYITSHADCDGVNTNDHLYHNNGNNTFTDVSYLLGGAGNPVLSRRGLVTTFFDYNNDGKVDIYVGQDIGGTYGANVMWQNDGPDGKNGWKFSDASSSTRSGLAMAGDMGIAVGDFNRDGLFDLYLTNMGCNVLLQMQSNSVYTQVASETMTHTARCMVPNSSTPDMGNTPFPTMVMGILWGTGAYDFNNDGWEDIFAAGGNIHKGIYWSAFFQSNQDSTFLDVSPLTGTLGTGAMQSMPTAAFTDYNNDGFMDIIAASMMGKPQLFRNNAQANGNPHNWLQVKLKGNCQSAVGCAGMASNRDAIGARIVAMVGGANLSRQVIDGATYQGNSTLVQQFGLGSANQVDNLTIYWPSGKITVMTNVLANQKLTIRE